MIQTDFTEQDVLKGMFRETTWAQRANTTAYAVGDRIYAATFDGNVYECITAGTSAGSPPAFNTTIGATTTDGSVTWLTLKLGTPKRPLYVGLFTTQPTQTGGGTEVTGGSYARQAYQPTDANWNAPGTDGNTSNKLAIAFPAPTADWGLVGYFAIWDRLTGGNMLWYGTLTETLTVSNGDVAPSFGIDAIQILEKRSRNPGLRTTIP